MTLLTKLVIVEPTPVREVFDECRRLLGGEDAVFFHKEGGYHNKSGQGLPALLSVAYGVDAPLVPDPEYPDERDAYPPVDAWSIEVCLETAYAYRAPNGAGCSDLHAWLIQQIGRWLTDRGLTWCWRNEFTGEWHPSSVATTELGNPERGRLSEDFSADPAKIEAERQAAFEAEVSAGWYDETDRDEPILTD